MPKSPEIHRTPKYRAKAAYRNMKSRCENQDGKNKTYTDVKLLMSLDEWLDWAIPEYEKIMENNPNLTPCVSRFGDIGHYELGNVEITSTLKNRKMMNTDHKKVDIICPNCHTKFVRLSGYVTQRNKDSNKMFCSKFCSGKYYKT